MHGYQYHRTWTRLAAPLAAGATSVSLQHAVNWEAGQTVLITGTTLKDARDHHQNEEITLASVSSDGYTITLATPTAHAHFATSAYQGEVALLSRRVLINGAAAVRAALAPAETRDERRWWLRAVAVRGGCVISSPGAT
jgi:hypothetical protein